MGYLVDNSVLHALANTQDMHHSSCKQFFDEHKGEALYFPIHALFEFKASRARRMKRNSFSGLPGSLVMKDQNFVNINRKLYDYCQNKNLFELFAELKGADLIYACIAKIGQYTLVTCDADFDIYADEISIVKLPE